MMMIHVLSERGLSILFLSVKSDSVHLDGSASVPAMPTLKNASFFCAVYYGLTSEQE